MSKPGNNVVKRAMEKVSPYDEYIAYMERDSLAALNKPSSIDEEAHDRIDELIATVARLTKRVDVLEAELAVFSKNVNDELNDVKKVNKRLW